MALDQLKNFSYSAVATAPSPATSGTTVTVTTGDGTKFAVGTQGQFWPTGVQPITSNCEIFRITGIAGDVLTIVRAQEGTTARTVVVGDQVMSAITAKLLYDLSSFATVTKYS